jgi:hypothetical protein
VERGARNGVCYVVDEVRDGAMGEGDGLDMANLSADDVDNV